MTNKYLIIGYGGIGQAICQKLMNDKHQVSLLTTRNDINLPSGTSHQLDLTQQDNITKLIEIIQSTQPDFIINTIGILHDKEHFPEKSIKQIQDAWVETSFKINLMPTIHLVKALDQYLNRHSQLKLISLSARVGSITDNRFGGWYSYRMSKAALNMFIKTVSIEWNRLYPECGIYAYHPGTVDTLLSKPFQANVPEKQLFSSEKASQYLLNVLASLTINDSGYLFDWQGKKIAF